MPQLAFWPLIDVCVCVISVSCHFFACFDFHMLFLSFLILPSSYCDVVQVHLPLIIAAGTFQLIPLPVHLCVCVCVSAGVGSACGLSRQQPHHVVESLPPTSPWRTQTAVTGCPQWPAINRDLALCCRAKSQDIWWPNSGHTHTHIRAISFSDIDAKSVLFFLLCLLLVTWCLDCLKLHMCKKKTITCSDDGVLYIS